MTKQEFVARWRTHLVGKLVLGTTEFRHSLKEALTVGGVDSADALGRVLAKLPAEADNLLGMIYDSLQPPVNGTNGHHANGTATKRLAVPEKVG